ncbi:MAG TPA: VOC family protein [Candidatus Limnocylindrales bacterium]|nr:VOC family protein [Candidatus Limnocylindrales bacterium]
MLPDRAAYPALRTADPDRLRRFYEDVLGFTVRDENRRTEGRARRSGPIRRAMSAS